MPVPWSRSSGGPALLVLDFGAGSSSPASQGRAEDGGPDAAVDERPVADRGWLRVRIPHREGFLELEFDWPQFAKEARTWALQLPQEDPQQLRGTGAQSIPDEQYVGAWDGRVLGTRSFSDDSEAAHPFGSDSRF